MTVMSSIVDHHVNMRESFFVLGASGGTTFVNAVVQWLQQLYFVVVSAIDLDSSIVHSMIAIRSRRHFQLLSQRLGRSFPPFQYHGRHCLRIRHRSHSPPRSPMPNVKISSTDACPMVTTTDSQIHLSYYMGHA